jgi:hypothetical protein
MVEGAKTTWREEVKDIYVEANKKYSEVEIMVIMGAGVFMLTALLKGVIAWLAM